MSAADNKLVVLEYVNAFNRGDLDEVCRKFAASAVIHTPFGSGGVDVVRPIWAEIKTCFRTKLALESIVQEEEVVVTRYTERGVFSAPFRGVAPTGKDYEMSAIEWFMMDKGKILGLWGVRDSASMFRQMGIPLR